MTDVELLLCNTIQIDCCRFFAILYDLECFNQGWQFITPFFLVINSGRGRGRTYIDEPWANPEATYSKLTVRNGGFWQWGAWDGGGRMMRLILTNALISEDDWGLTNERHHVSPSSQSCYGSTGPLLFLQKGLIGRSHGSRIQKYCEISNRTTWWNAETWSCPYREARSQAKGSQDSTLEAWDQTRKYSCSSVPNHSTL